MTSVARGLTWSKDWVSRGEGPYTRLAKLSIANPLPLPLLQKIVTDAPFSRIDRQGIKHPRTLLDNLWLFRWKAPELCEWSSEFSASMLSSTTESWTERLASDERFRYCPSCLSYGFQSSLCQIEFITHCPVHGDALRDSCLRCGASTPRYAWNEALSGMNAVLCCLQCGHAFGDAWHRNNHLRWHPMTGSEAYTAIAEEIARFRDVAWIDETGWIERFRWLPISEKKVFEFQLLGLIFGKLSELSLTLQASDYLSVMKIPLIRYEASPPQVGIIDFCKAYEKTCFRLGDSCASEHRRMYLGKNDTRLNQPLILDSYRNKKSISAHLFRSRFENAPNFFDFELPIIPGAFRPQCLSFATQFSLDVRGWCRFFWTCYQADLGFASLIAQRTAGLKPQDKCWAEILSAHAGGLIPRALNLPPGVGLLRVGTGKGAYAVLVSVAMPVAGRYPPPGSLANSQD